MRFGEIGVEGERVPQEVLAIAVARCREGVEIGVGELVEFPGAEILSRRPRRPPLLGEPELGRDPGRDRARELFLQKEGVRHAAVRLRRPDRARGLRIDELDARAKLRLGHAHASRHHVAHAELLGHLGDRCRAVAKGEGGAAGDDSEPAMLRQRGEHGLGEPVAEPGRAIARHIERQHGQSRPHAARRGRGREGRAGVGEVRDFRRACPRVGDRRRDGVRRARLAKLDPRQEAEAAAVDGRDRVLARAVVAERVPHGLDLARERRVAHEAPPPDRPEDLVLGDRATAIGDEQAQDVEAARLDRYPLAVPPQLVASRIELVGSEPHRRKRFGSAPGRPEVGDVLPSHGVLRAPRGCAPTRMTVTRRHSVTKSYREPEVGSSAAGRYFPAAGGKITRDCAR